jgi:hypothetical protein
MRRGTSYISHSVLHELSRQVWTFVLKDATLKLDNQEIIGPVDKVKIVACKGSVAGDEGKGSKRKKKAKDEDHDSA